MKISKNKKLTIAISVILMLTMTVSTMLVPDANAHTPAWNITDHAYISLAPNLGKIAAGLYVRGIQLHGALKLILGLAPPVRSAASGLESPAFLPYARASHR